MLVEVVDPSGGGLALAVGLAQLGCDVLHRGPAAWAAPGAPPLARASRDLQQHFCRPADGAADLLVLVDVFADHLRVLEHGRACVDHAGALHGEGGALAYPTRLRDFCERAARAPAVVVVDMSDERTGREVAFESFPHAALLARECPAAGDGAWRPFPFLHNQTLLWLELLRPRAEWWVEPAARRPAHDWAFCGTVDHPRYGDRRRRALAACGARWPGRTGVVVDRAPFVDVLRTLQSVRFGVDLAGVGELCFRLHECLALGVPVVRPEPLALPLPAGLGDVVAADPDALPACDPHAVRAAYEAHYAPRAAAARLLAAAGETRVALCPRARPTSAR